MRQPIGSRRIGLGLQRRIMLYVAVGLAVMLGGVAFLGLGAIDQATELVFHERLSAAHTTARILERDLGSVAAESREETQEWAVMVSTGQADAGPATALMGHFASGDPSAFFRVSGIWVLDSDGSLLEQTGEPSATPALLQTALARLGAGGTPTAILESLASVEGGTAFASIAVSVVDLPRAGPLTVVINTVSTNSAAAFVPAAPAHPGAADGVSKPTGLESLDEYHLEVIDPGGIAILGIGADEEPGQPSHHFEVIQGLVDQHGAAALLHEPERGETFEPHVMAVVPVAGTPFYLVLEQAVDVALALPLQLRERLLVSIGAGFIGALAVAWLTTRRVVRPTEQLTTAAQRMAAGNLTSPVAVTAQDEVGRLAESLETMRQRLLAANQALEDTNRELETRVAERTARLGDLLRKTITAQEEERHRLARELHDETAQTLDALSIGLDRARDSLGPSDEPAQQHVQEAKVIATRLLEETRRLILGLRPAMLDDMGLIPAVRWLCENSLGDQGVQVVVTENLGEQRLPAHVEVAVFRIIQEAISNIARHAGASHAWIELARDPANLTVVVRDDGRGFDVGATLRAGERADSVGLSGMQERVSLLDGILEIHSGTGTGTAVMARIPVGAAAP